MIKKDVARKETRFRKAKTMSGDVSIEARNSVTFVLYMGAVNRVEKYLNLFYAETYHRLFFVVSSPARIVVGDCVDKIEKLNLIFPITLRNK